MAGCKNAASNKTCFGAKKDTWDIFCCRKTYLGCVFLSKSMFFCPKVCFVGGTSSTRDWWSQNMFATLKTCSGYVLKALSMFFRHHETGRQNMLLTHPCPRTELLASPWMRSVPNRGWTAGTAEGVPAKAEMICNGSSSYGCGRIPMGASAGTHGPPYKEPGILRFMKQ